MSDDEAYHPRRLRPSASVDDLWETYDTERNGGSFYDGESDSDGSGSDMDVDHEGPAFGTPPPLSDALQDTINLQTETVRDAFFDAMRGIPFPDDFDVSSMPASMLDYLAAYTNHTFQNEEEEGDDFIAAHFIQGAFATHAGAQAMVGLPAAEEQLQAFQAQAAQEATKIVSDVWTEWWNRLFQDQGALTTETEAQYREALSQLGYTWLESQHQTYVDMRAQLSDLEAQIGGPQAPALPPHSITTMTVNCIETWFDGTSTPDATYTALQHSIVSTFPGISPGFALTVRKAVTSMAGLVERIVQSQQVYAQANQQIQATMQVVTTLEN